MSTITFFVNGERRAIQAAPDTPLLWVLRDELNLKGTKFSCGLGECGACTVELDGKPVRSCITPVSDVANRRVTTIENTRSPILKALQSAWITEQVPQCGYCQPGMLMQATALLEKNRQPSVAEIDAWMSDNLCRCGTYLRIRRAIQRAAREVSHG